MDDLLKDYDEESVTLSTREVFTKIWTSPKTVFRFINETGYDKYAALLLCLAGIVKSLDRSAGRNAGNSQSLVAMLAGVIIGGALFGYISYHIYAALMNWTGKWLKAEGNTRSVLRMLAYAMIPSVCSLVLLVGQLIFYGNGYFMADGIYDEIGNGSYIIPYTLALLQFVLGMWSLVLCVIGTSIVQNLSIGKAILNLLLPALVVFLPVIFIIMLFYNLVR